MVSLFVHNGALYHGRPAGGCRRHPRSTDGVLDGTGDNASGLLLMTASLRPPRQAARGDLRARWGRGWVWEVGKLRRVPMLPADADLLARTLDVQQPFRQTRMARRAIRRGLKASGRLSPDRRYPAGRLSIGPERRRSSTGDGRSTLPGGGIHRFSRRPKNSRCDSRTRRYWSLANDVERIGTAILSVPNDAMRRVHGS